MRHWLPAGFIASLLIADLLLGPAILQAAEQIRQPSKGAAAVITDKELNAFVKSYVEYQKIRLHYTPALEKAKDPGQKKQIEQEANGKVKHALDANGLSVNRYNQIFAAVNSDPALREKILKQVEEKRRNS